MKTLILNFPFAALNLLDPGTYDVKDVFGVELLDDTEVNVVQ